MPICPATAPAKLIGINALPKRRQLLRGYMRDAADLQATPGSMGTVRIIVVPHCTQQWVTSSRPVAAAPSASSAGSIAVNPHNSHTSDPPNAPEGALEP
jgi:hypothetical protein